ncbi:MAG: HipA domain-containing protein [Burkholderiales bacterium]
MHLEVWLDRELAGRLSYDPDSNRFSFVYDTAWLNRSDAYPLGTTLPLLAGPTTPDEHSAKVRQFFENLLPEGQALDDAANIYRISKTNLTGLLIALGRETAGAVRLVMPGAMGQDSERRRLITMDELSERIRARPQMPFTVWDGKVRLSIAGFQDKLAVLEEAGDWYLVEGPDLASTHILKPEPVNPVLVGLTSNEFFCMKLAAACGLDTAPVALQHVPEPVLSVARFDRYRDAAAVRRRHVIDGCQLLGLPSGFKYERPYGDSRDVRNIRDGASLTRFFTAIKVSPQPARAQLLLLRWLVFQVLLGNTDAHAKNLSFYMTATGPIQAPAYDLVCGALYHADNVSQTYAMAIGDAFSTEELSAYEWARFCVATGVNPNLVRNEIGRGVKIVRTQLAQVSEAVLRKGAVPRVVEQITEVVAAECSRQLNLAPHIKGMMGSAR